MASKGGALSIKRKKYIAYILFLFFIHFSHPSFENESALHRSIVQLTYTNIRHDPFYKLHTIISRDHDPLYNLHTIS